MRRGHDRWSVQSLLPLQSGSSTARGTSSSVSYCRNTHPFTDHQLCHLPPSKWRKFQCFLNIISMYLIYKLYFVYFVYIYVKRIRIGLWAHVILYLLIHCIPMWEIKETYTKSYYQIIKDCFGNQAVWNTPLSSDQKINDIYMIWKI